VLHVDPSADIKAVSRRLKKEKRDILIEEDFLLVL